MVCAKSKRAVTWKYMNIVICDDERIFANELEFEIRKIASRKDLVISIRKFTISKLLLASDLSDCDVIFLDIDMPAPNGLEAAKTLRENYPDLILVFVTGWIEYAPAGYRVNAFRYLLKKNLAEDLPICLDEIQDKLLDNSTVISFSTRERTIEIAVRNILYLEGTPRRSVLLYLKQLRTPIECVGKLSDYETELHDKGFLRLQKSYLANMNNIEKIKNYYAVLTDGTSLKVSERQYSKVCKTFLMWKGPIR